jgi:hypothetical protein
MSNPLTRLLLKTARVSADPHTGSYFTSQAMFPNGCQFIERICCVDISSIQVEVQRAYRARR